MAQVARGGACHRRHAASRHLSVRALPEVLRHEQVTWQRSGTGDGIAQRAAVGVRGRYPKSSVEARRCLSHSAAKTQWCLGIGPRPPVSNQHRQRDTDFFLPATAKEIRTRRAAPLPKVAGTGGGVHRAPQTPPHHHPGCKATQWRHNLGGWGWGGGRRYWLGGGVRFSPTSHQHRREPPAATARRGARRRKNFLKPKGRQR